MQTEKWENGKKLVRVMKEVSDGSKDYWVPLAYAKELQEKGKIFFELNNRCYCEV